MIHLEHINLVVNDIPKMLEFYQVAFPHWKVRDTGQGEWHGKPRTWLHFGDQYHYIALSDNGVGTNRDLAGHQIGLAHFAFVTNNVDSVTERLTTAGFLIANPGTKEPHRKNVYLRQTRPRSPRRDWRRDRHRHGCRRLRTLWRRS